MSNYKTTENVPQEHIKDEVFSPDVSMGYKVFIGNVLISSSRDLNIFEERYLALLIAKASEQLRKYKHLSGHRFQPDSIICPKYMLFSPKELLYNSKNYDKVRQACTSMASKTISFWTETPNGKKIDRTVHLTGPIDINPGTGRDSPYIKLRIENELWELLLDMSNGFSAIDLKYMFRLKRPSSMRLLPMFFSIGRNPTDKKHIPDYSIERLRTMFCKQEEYRDNAAFIKKVIDPALEEIRQLDGPFFGEAEVIRDGRNRIWGVRFIPRINLDKFEVAFPCLLPDNTVFRSNKIAQLFSRDFNWAKIPKQIENIISFAQEYIEDDNELYNLISDIRPKLRSSETGEIGGFITLMRHYLRKKYEVEYIAPSKGGNVLPVRQAGRPYTDWQLLKYPDLQRNDYEEERLKALIEAQKERYSENFMKTKQAADCLMKSNYADAPDFEKSRLVYGVEHLSDRQIFENVFAGIISDENVAGIYDESSYKRFEFILSLQLDCDMNHTAEFTWEYVQRKLKEKFGQQPQQPALDDNEVLRDPAYDEPPASLPTTSYEEREEERRDVTEPHNSFKDVFD